MITKRTAERLLRETYEFHDLASRLREAGYAFEAESVVEIARIVNRVGNALLDRLGARP